MAPPWAAANNEAMRVLCTLAPKTLLPLLLMALLRDQPGVMVAGLAPLARCG